MTGERRRVVIVGTAVASVLVAATALALSMAGDSDEVRVGAQGGPTTGSEGGQGADVLEVDCSEGQVAVSARRVRTHPDGVHVHVTNLPDDGTSVELATVEAPKMPPVAALAGAFAEGEHVLGGIRPGLTLVRCYPVEGPRHMLSAQEDPTAVRVEIADPGKHWTAPGELECRGNLMQSMTPDYAVGRDGKVIGADRRSFEEVLADAPLGTRAGDEVRTAGYAEGGARWVEVVRDGRVVARAAYRSDGGSWLLGGMDSCAEAAPGG